MVIKIHPKWGEKRKSQRKQNRKERKIKCNRGLAYLGPGY